MNPYTGRFAPSPTGPLHVGSVVAALASWLDARANKGIWLVRMEDVDEPRCKREHGEEIMRQLAALGLEPDGPVLWQSARQRDYQAALDPLQRQGHAYACACSRKDIEAALAESGLMRERNGELVYPGTCRQGLQGKPARAARFRCPDTSVVNWADRRLGQQTQDVTHDVGDFVLLRADGFFAYQLAVVVDDAAQGVTHIVRGEDLADNTARQILLQRALGLSTPRYLHTPLVLGDNGEKLSKQNGAQPANTEDAAGTLRLAARVLGLRLDDSVCTIPACLEQAVQQWAGLYNLTP